MPDVHADVVLPPADTIIAGLNDLVSPNFFTDDPNAVNVRAGALFARLKALNRAANSATRAHKQAMYEKRHLEREIEKCQQFASIYQDIPLYTLEKFVELAPEPAKAPEVLNNEHQLMLNRLSFELAERQRLDLKQKELIKQKEELLKESKAQAAVMENVKVQIDALIKNATDVQKKIGDLVPATSSMDVIES